MREFKFRYYDTSIKAMLTPSCVGEYGFYPDDRDFEDGNSLPFDRLMQYTGLKDMNGKDIYESDIVRILYTDWPSQTDHSIPLDEYKKSISSIGAVKWNDIKWAIEVPDKIYGSFFNGIRPGRHGEIEVIGNIYQNPELLNP
jgi:uncharacterized phage protein (TIGR01671 family)